MSAPDNPRFDPIRLSTSTTVRKTRDIQPGEWVAVDGVVEPATTGENLPPLDLVPQPGGRPVPSDGSGADDTPEGEPAALRSLSGSAEEGVVRAYSVERIAPMVSSYRREVSLTAGYASLPAPFWSAVFAGVVATPFRVADDAGTVRVEAGASLTAGPVGNVITRDDRPGWHVDDGVEIEATHYSFDEYPVVGSAAAGDTAGGQVTAFARAALEEAPESLTLRYRERTVQVGDAAYVLGWATEHDGEVVITPPEPGGTFLLSSKRL